MSNETIEQSITMDNHPIPQDITGFQFKLIGTMTVRQFIYLAIGAVLAWFFFFILPLPFLISLPLAIIFLGTGAAFAFLPIDGRPMDVMTINLIKAVFAPTQYIYKKRGGQIPKASPPPPSKTVQTRPTSVISPAKLAPAPVPQPPHEEAPHGVIEFSPEQTPKPPPLEKEDQSKILETEKKLEGEVDSLKKELAEAKAMEQTETNIQNLPAAHQRAQELEKELAKTQRQKEELEKELLMLKSKLETQKEETFDPTLAKPLRQTQRVRKIPQGMEKTVGTPKISDAPNLITGIIKDPRGNPLPNILIEVKDPEDNPVRAFKTNALGQFASATSLSNGRYIVSFEDPKGEHKFDAVEIEATGVPLMPIEIISIDAREELRRELFN